MITNSTAAIARPAGHTTPPASPVPPMTDTAKEYSIQSVPVVGCPMPLSDMVHTAATPQKKPEAMLAMRIMRSVLTAAIFAARRLPPVASSLRPATV